MTEIATVWFEQEGAIVIASLAGEVDPSNVRTLGRELTAAVPNDAMGVVLDLSLVDYLDSSGVQLVFELAERLEARQQRLAVAVPPYAPPHRVLEIVALDQTVPMVATRGEALALLS